MEAAPTNKVPVEAKREGISTPLISITKYLETNFGKPVKRSVLLETGVSNEVYEMTNEDGEEFICRIAKDKPHNRFGEEKWALDRARDVGAPVPQVLAITREVVDGATYDICFESKIPGKALYEIHDLSKEEIAGLLGSTGEVLSMIHSIPVNGFGKFDTEGKGEFSSIQEILHDPYIEKEELLKLAQELGLNTDTIKKAYDIMESGSASYPKISPSLVHGDFTPKHILVDNKKVTGIIDFENAMGGDPVMDLAHWHFFFKDQLNVEEIIKGYKPKEDISTDFDRIFNLWRVYFGLMHLKFQCQKKNQVGIDFAQQQITDDVRYFYSHLLKPEAGTLTEPATDRQNMDTKEPITTQNETRGLSFEFIEQTLRKTLSSDENIKRIEDLAITSTDNEISISITLIAKEDRAARPMPGLINLKINISNTNNGLSLNITKLEYGWIMNSAAQKIKKSVGNLLDILKVNFEQTTNTEVGKMEIQDGEIKVILKKPTPNTQTNRRIQIDKITERIKKMFRK